MNVIEDQDIKEHFDKTNDEAAGKNTVLKRAKLIEELAVQGKAQP